MDSQLQVFKNKKFGEIKVSVIEDIARKKYLVIDGEIVNKFQLLALASKIGWDDEKIAWDVMRLASILHHTEDDFAFNELYGAVAMEITRKNQRNECDLYPLFERNVNKVLGTNAKIIEKRNHPKHVPDFWVEISGEISPVEIKLNAFDARALRQLKRYMHFYNTSRGIAVGANLTTDLPSDIVFISTKELEG